MNAVAAEIEDTLPAPPPFAEAVEIVPRIHMLRMPLSGMINHVNCWLLDDGDTWTMVDFGTNTDPIRAAWETVFAGPLKGKRIGRMVATHGHIDHVGYAGPLGERLGLPLLTTRTEWLASSFRRNEARSPMPAYVTAFFNRHGCGPDYAEAFDQSRQRMARELCELPQLVRIRAGDRLTMAGRDWVVITAAGHAPEHASFWCEDEHLLIAGDQLLPRTSPTLSITPAEPYADPLGEYLASLHHFAPLPDGAFVLTSHGIPYYGLKHRLRELREHHRDRLERVRGAVDRSRTADEVARIAYARATTDGRARFAFFETLARLNHLVEQGSLVRTDDPDGRQRYAPP